LKLKDWSDALALEPTNPQKNPPAYLKNVVFMLLLQSFRKKGLPLSEGVL
jgi:hypothetical protein